MDVETVSALERIGERVDGLNTSLRTEIVAFRDGLHQEIAALREDLAESRRHAVMLNESTREDIRFVADAVAGLSLQIDSLRR